MTNEDLAALCRKWQPRLRLSDWRFEIKFVPRLSSYGTIQYDRLRKEAAIKILEESAMKARYGYAPVEATVVHEMQHLNYPDMPKKGKLKDELEASIDVSTVILMEARWQ